MITMLIFTTWSAVNVLALVKEAQVILPILTGIAEVRKTFALKESFVKYNCGLNCVEKFLNVL